MTKRKTTRKAKKALRSHRAPAAVGYVAEVTHEHKSCRIRHKEFVRDINNDTGFIQDALQINPGLSATFPWLSGVASRYEKYRFNRLMFEFLPYQPTDTAGAMFMAIDYDANDSVDVSKEVMMTYEGSVRSSIWMKGRVHAASPGLNRTLFVRDGIPRASGVVTDLKTMDVGNLIIASTNALAQDAPLGELYVYYDVTLLIPQTEPEAETFILKNLDVGAGSAVGFPMWGKDAEAARANIALDAGFVGGVGPNSIDIVKPGLYTILAEGANRVSNVMTNPPIVNAVTRLGSTLTAYGTTNDTAVPGSVMGSKWLVDVGDDVSWNDPLNISFTPSTTSSSNTIAAALTIARVLRDGMVNFI